jgi:hypothetical protein
MCVCIYIHLYVHIYVYNYINTCIHTYIYVYIHTYIHLHTQIHKHTHIYTHRVGPIRVVGEFNEIFQQLLVSLSVMPSSDHAVNHVSEMILMCG